MFSPRALASLLRGWKVLVGEVALAALSAGWAVVQNNGNLDPGVTLIIVTVGNPIVLGAEKWLKWFETQP